MTPTPVLQVEHDTTEGLDVVCACGAAFLVPHDALGALVDCAGCGTTCTVAYSPLKAGDHDRFSA